MMFYIYLLENKINHKKYIGQTCRNPQERWKNGHGYNRQGVIGQAIQKYGWDNFDRIILEQVQTQEETNERFETAVEAGKRYNVDSSALCKHLNHPETYKSCGKHPITQERLHWKRI